VAVLDSSKTKKTSGWALMVFAPLLLSVPLLRDFRGAASLAQWVQDLALNTASLYASLGLALIFLAGLSWRANKQSLEKKASQRKLLVPPPRPEAPRTPAPPRPAPPVKDRPAIVTAAPPPKPQPRLPQPPRPEAPRLPAPKLPEPARPAPGLPVPAPPLPKPQVRSPQPEPEPPGPEDGGPQEQWSMWSLKLPEPTPEAEPPGPEDGDPHKQWSMGAPKLPEPTVEPPRPEAPKLPEPTPEPPRPEAPKLPEPTAEPPRPEAPKLPEPKRPAPGLPVPTPPAAAPPAISRPEPPPKAPSANAPLGWLEAVQGPLKGQRFPITGPTRIGGKRGSDITIRDPEVSPVHADIFPEGPDLCLYDARSTSGTFVNHVSVLHHVLADGDSVRIGSSQFIFRRSAQ